MVNDMSVRIAHRYTLYIWSDRLYKYVKCRTFDTLEKIEKFFTEMKKQSRLPDHLQSWYMKKHIPVKADLTKFYVEHTTTRIVQEVLSTEVVNI